MQNWQIEFASRPFGKLIIPDAVWLEVVASDPGKAGVREVSEATWIEQQTVKDRPLVNLLRQDLGAGESEAIVLARECGADVLLMDERRGREAAKRLGLTYRPDWHSSRSTQTRSYQRSG